MPAARAWSVYEGSCSTLLPSPETVRAFSADALALGLARMEAHYFRNSIFLPENYLLDNIDRIRNIPTEIVQGRYDLVCPVRSADDLARAWPQARLHHHSRCRPLRHGTRHARRRWSRAWKRSRAWRNGAGIPCPPAASWPRL